MKVSQIISLVSWLNFLAWLWITAFGWLSPQETWQLAVMFIIVGIGSGVVSIDNRTVTK